MELKERKCARFTSEEKTHETIRMGESLKDSWYCFKFALSVFLPWKGKYPREGMNPPSRLTKSLGALRDTTTDNKAECFHSLHDPVFKSLSSAIKEAIFGKSLLVYLETIRRVAKIGQRKVKYNARILAGSFSARTFFLLLTFLVGNGSSVSFFSALWSRTVLEICRFLLVLT